MLKKNPLKNAFTQEELLIIWLNRFSKNSVKMMEVVPDRTQRSLKHVIGSFKKVSEIDEEYLLRNREITPVTVLDEELNLNVGTSTSYFKMKGLNYVSRMNGHTKAEIQFLKDNLNDMTYHQMADELGLTEVRVRNLASKLGLYKKFEWTPDKIEKVVSEIQSGKTLEEAGSIYNRDEKSVRVMLNLNELHEHVPESRFSKYVPSKPEVYIINFLNKELNVSIPEKCRGNREYFWGIIPPYEVDIPFYLKNEKFAIEHDGSYWHSSADRIRRDEIKEKLLLEKGFHYFIITDNMYDRYNMETLDPVLENLCKEVRDIIS